ncbi:hypothetical protein CEXT_630771 [Caerostris extrusa]|uniref:Uncharacterized protein n=1 Tax=Caerostris extrusa TaxID=172846 RepID=A0AAV4R1U9_CAEEX|nr:hypothetical protein CEXT_630771 [Caerostris extrusa]
MRRRRHLWQSCPPIKKQWRRRVRNKSVSRREFVCLDKLPSLSILSSRFCFEMARFAALFYERKESFRTLGIFPCVQPGLPVSNCGEHQPQHRQSHHHDIHDRGEPARLMPDSHLLFVVEMLRV